MLFVSYQHKYISKANKDFIFSVFQNELTPLTKNNFL